MRPGERFDRRWLTPLLATAVFLCFWFLVFLVWAQLSSGDLASLTERDLKIGGVSIFELGGEGPDFFLALGVLQLLIFLFGSQATFALCLALGRRSLGGLVIAIQVAVSPLIVIEAAPTAYGASFSANVVIPGVSWVAVLMSFLLMVVTLRLASTPRATPAAGCSVSDILFLLAGVVGFFWLVVEIVGTARLFDWPELILPQIDRRLMSSELLVGLSALVGVWILFNIGHLVACGLSGGLWFSSLLIFPGLLVCALGALLRQWSWVVLWNWRRVVSYASVDGTWVFFWLFALAVVALMTRAAAKGTRNAGSRNDTVSEDGQAEIDRGPKGRGTGAVLGVLATVIVAAIAGWVVSELGSARSRVLRQNVPGSGLALVGLPAGTVCSLERAVGAGCQLCGFWRSPAEAGEFELRFRCRDGLAALIIPTGTAPLAPRLQRRRGLAVTGTGGCGVGNQQALRNLAKAMEDEKHKASADFFEPRHWSLVDRRSYPARPLIVQGDEAIVLSQTVVRGCQPFASHFLAQDNHPGRPLGALRGEAVLWAGRDGDGLTVVAMRDVSPVENKALLRIIRLRRDGEAADAREFVWDAAQWPSRLWPGIADFAAGRFILAQKRDDPLGHSRFYVYDLAGGSFVGRPVRGWLAFLLEEPDAERVATAVSNIARATSFDRR